MDQSGFEPEVSPLPAVRDIPHKLLEGMFRVTLLAHLDVINMLDLKT